MAYDYAVGVDPGFTGYITVLSAGGELVEFFKTPVVKEVKKTKHRDGRVSTKTKQQLDEPGIKAFMRKYRSRDGVRLNTVVTVERQHAMSYEGRASIAKTMYGFGFWCGLTRGLGLKLQVVRAVEWQNHFFTTTAAERKADKDITKKKSVESVKLWNKDIDLRKTKRSKKDDHNLADSICIARYCWVKNTKPSGEINGRQRESEGTAGAGA